MSREKYHAQIDFQHGLNRLVRFTAVDLEKLLARFTKECLDRQEANRRAGHYVWLEPNLTVEVCNSWSQFDQYEHAGA